MASTPTPPSLVLQDRDIETLRGLLECRVATGEQIASIHFDGRFEYAKKRIQKLKAAGLIAQRPRKPYEPAVLYLAKGGLEPLRDRGILQQYPAFSIPALLRRALVSPRTLPHELEVMDVKAAFCAAIRKNPKLSIAEFTTWPLLNQFVVGGEPQQPDAFIRIHEREADGGVSEHCFFLEVDRSTEPQSLLGQRAAAYLAYHYSGGFAERCGGNKTEFKNYPFRVLYVLKTQERRNNTAETLLRLNPPIRTHVWLSTLAEVTNDPVGPVWLRPLDYRDATVGSPYELENKKLTAGYQRQTARDLLVATHAKKLRLLDNG